MTSEQAARSVSIAEDVLKHLKAMRIKTGSFLSPRGDDIFAVEMPNEDLAAYLPETRATCDVCALGACFLSHLGLSKQPYIMSAQEAKCGIEFNELEPLLVDAMGERNMILIEAAFEEGHGWFDETDLAYTTAVTYDDLYDAIGFGGSWTSDESRLRAIMQNVIDNKGMFTPGEAAIA